VRIIELCKMRANFVSLQVVRYPVFFRVAEKSLTGNPLIWAILTPSSRPPIRRPWSTILATPFVIKMWFSKFSYLLKGIRLRDNKEALHLPQSLGSAHFLQGIGYQFYRRLPVKLPRREPCHGLLRPRICDIATA